MLGGLIGWDWQASVKMESSKQQTIILCGCYGDVPRSDKVR